MRGITYLAMTDAVAREQQRAHEDAATLAEVRRLWRIVHDYGSTFSTPRERLAAGDRLRSLLD